LLEVAARTGLRVCVTDRKHGTLRLCLRDPRTREHARGLAAGRAAATGGGGGGAASSDGAGDEGGGGSGGGGGGGGDGGAQEGGEAEADALLARCFTTDPRETPIYVVDWGAGAGVTPLGKGLTASGA
jgi:hypothetical protein